MTTSRTPKYWTRVHARYDLSCHVCGRFDVPLLDGESRIWCRDCYAAAHPAE